MHNYDKWQPRVLQGHIEFHFNARQTQVTLQKKKRDLLRLKRSGSHKGEHLDSCLLGIACERSLRGFSHQNVRGEHGKARTF